MKINKLFTLILVLWAIIFTSCSDDNTPDLPKGDYDKGILISGEGSGSTGSISYVSNDLTTNENLIYKKVNNSELGTFLQSIAFDDDSAYIIVDNQNTITAVDRYSFTKKGEITTNLETPRYMVVSNGKGYVTNWGTTEGFVAVFDMNSYSFIKKITISTGPERILEKNGKLYVSHKGGNGSNNVISVIDISTDGVQEIIVNDKPDEMFFNNSGNLVVLSEGKAAWTNDETLAAISKIDLNDNSVTKMEFKDGEHPSLMVFDNNVIYYNLSNKVYKMNTSETSLSTAEFLTIELFTTGYSEFYGMEVKENKLYALSTRFSDLSELRVFNLIDNSKIKTIEAPIGASKIYFNN